MKKARVLLMPLFILMAACSSTNVINSWKDKEVVEQTTLKKVMVLAMLPEKERVLRQELESEMVEDLQKRGFIAVSSLQEYGPRSFAGMNEKQVMQELDKSRIDGVITIALQDTETNERYVPGSVRYEPYAVRYNRFYRTYQTFYERIYTPGHTDQQTSYFFETNLYQLNGNKLLYSAQSKSFDPSSASQIAKEVAKAVVKDMEKNDILGLAVAKH
jgi:hypothetical protein